MLTLVIVALAVIIPLLAAGMYLLVAMIAAAFGKDAMAENVARVFDRITKSVKA